jgi:GTPase SAR1 family protein
MKIGVPYKRQKENVIDLFKDYLDKRGQTHDGNDIDFWNKRVENLKNKKYTITVAGEVSAGKSTFLNALLGVELLPTGVRQLTSAIVELSKSESPYLQVRFANKKKKRFKNHNTVIEKLSELCAIPEQYQSIPTTLIDTLIQRTDDELEVNDEFISNLEKASKKNNLFRHEDLIKKYLKNRKKADIPLEIQVGYPLKWDFDELRIVDSPGVNALGGVQDITYNFLNTSNAVLFVQNIQQLELQSFREFVENQITSTSRDKNTLFLILTHAGLHPNDLVESQTEKAVDLYSDLIPPERILAVDSLLKVIQNQFSNGENYEEIKKEDIKRRILADFRDQAEERNIKLEDLVLKASRFEEMEKAIDDFAMEAPTLQLKEIVEAIKKGYLKLEGFYDEQIEDLTLKKKNPVEFEKSIEKKKKEISEWEVILLKTGSQVENKFKGRKSHWKNILDELSIEYPKKINRAASKDYARSEFSNAKEEVVTLKNSFINEVSSFIKGILKEEANSFKTDHKITLPEVDIDSIEKRAKENSFESKDITEKQRVRIREWWILWSWPHFEEREVVIRKEDVFNEEKFLGNYKSELQTKLYDLIEELPAKFDELLSYYIDDFKSLVSEVIKARQDGLDQLKDDKSNNDELISKVEELKSKKKSIPSEYKRIDEILGDLP